MVNEDENKELSIDELNNVIQIIEQIAKIQKITKIKERENIQNSWMDY